jgi:hypothetical protein
MSDALDSMTGIIPLVVVAGVATKMTNSLFDQKPKRATKKSKKKNNTYIRKARKLLGS